MDDNQNLEARELHRTLEFIGLRAQATSVGLIQLCAELVKARVFDDAAIQRIKDAIYREITLSHGRGHSREEFEDMLRQRLDAIFPHAQDDRRTTRVGTVGEMETALDPNAPNRPPTKD
jgi:hypothetical protein